MDPLVLGASVIALALAMLVIGYAIGQGICRRQTRAHLWVLFHVIDAEPAAGSIRLDILQLIKRLEI